MVEYGVDEAKDEVTNTAIAQNLAYFEQYMLRMRYRKIGFGQKELRLETQRPGLVKTQIQDADHYEFLWSLTKLIFDFDAGKAE